MTLVCLTVVVILGISTSLRVQGRRTPRFVTAALHRNFGLFTLVLLAVHIATSVLDPFAGIRPVDAVIPFSGAYRTFWLGLGVLAAEVLLGVTHNQRPPPTDRRARVAARPLGHLCLLAHRRSARVGHGF